jgi:Ca-activated chloride channel family protein
VTWSFHFLRPWWLLALIAAPLLLRAVAQSEDVRARWRDTIAPHLLDHLVVARSSTARFRPVHLTALMLVLGALALAGPTWQRERPPFVEDQAPLAIALDLSPTMDAIDVSPSRVERAKLKIHDLLALRPGARTAVFAYAGSAHMVLPLTDDANLIRTYVDALATGLMPVAGKDTAGALGTIDDALAREETPGTIVFLTDGIEPAAAAAFAKHGGKNQILVLGIGTAAGGPVKTGTGSFLEDDAGGRVVAKLDTDALKGLARGDVEVATVTPDDTDVRWIARRARTHLAQKTTDEQSRWQDEGYWLTIPIALCGALWFRRGWTVRWVTGVLVAVVLAIATPSPAYAAGSWFADLWLTRDQQGRLAYERGDDVAAAELFTDPTWRGVALYRAGKLDDALTSFARVDSADSDYDQGNALARLGKLDAAAARYRAALARRPDWPEAKDNLALVEKLAAQKKKDDEQEADEPNEKPDQVQFDDKGKQGKRGEVDVAAQTTEAWMRSIQTTPAQLLARKFALEAQRKERTP